MVDSCTIVIVVASPLNFADQNNKGSGTIECFLFIRGGNNHIACPVGNVIIPPGIRWNLISRHSERYESALNRPFPELFRLEYELIQADSYLSEWWEYWNCKCDRIPDWNILGFWCSFPAVLTLSTRFSVRVLKFIWFCKAILKNLKLNEQIKHQITKCA